MNIHVLLITLCCCQYVWVLPLNKYVSISISPALCLDYTWSFRFIPSFISLHIHPSPVGQMFLSPHYREINLGSGSSVVLKARVQTQTDLPCPRPITLPLSYLEIPNYKPPPTSFHHAIHLPSFLLHIHTLYSPTMMKIFFTHMASYYLVFIPAASSPSFLPGILLTLLASAYTGVALRSLSQAPSPENIRCSGYITSKYSVLPPLFTYHIP